MTDLAVLGIEVRSDGVLIANDRLKAMNAVGAQSQGVFQKMAIAAAGLNQGLQLVKQVIGKVVEVTDEWIQAASMTEESNSKFAVTFDEAASSAEMTAKALAKATGSMESTAKQLLANTGDILGGLGATDQQALSLSNRVQLLGADIASFTNYSGGAVGAADALTKAMLGEREMAKSLGIVIREEDVQGELLARGLKNLTGTALTLAKAEITLDIATKQSTNSVGDLARTWDSYANMSRRADEVSKGLKEELGRALLPTVSKLKGAITELKEEMLADLKAFNDYRDALKQVEEGHGDIDDAVTILTSDLKEQKAIYQEWILQQQRSTGLTRENAEQAYELAKGWDESTASYMRMQGVTVDTLKTQLDSFDAVYSTTKIFEDLVGWVEDEARQQRLAKSELEGKLALEKDIAAKIKEQNELREKQFKTKYQSVLDIINDAQTEVERLDIQINDLFSSWNLAALGAGNADELIMYKKIGEAIDILVQKRNALVDPGFQKQRDENAQKELDNIRREKAAYINLLEIRSDRAQEKLQEIADASEEYWKTEIDNAQEAIDAQIEYNMQLEATRVKIGEDLVSAIESMLATEFVNTMWAAGEALAAAAIGADTFESAMQSIGLSILKALPNLFIAAGLQAIAAGLIPLGIGLLAAGGFTALVGGAITQAVNNENATIPAHGEGGYFDRPHLAIVGDKPEFIIPRDKMPQMGNVTYVTYNIGGSMVTQRQIASEVSKRQQIAYGRY